MPHLEIKIMWSKGLRLHWDLFKVDMEIKSTLQLPYSFCIKQNGNIPNIKYKKLINSYTQVLKHFPVKML